MSPASPLLRRAITAIAAIASVAAFCLAVILARSWNASREATKEMRVVFGVQAPILKQSEKREEQRDAVLTQSLAKIVRQERTTKTPVEIARRLPSALPPLPQPVAVSFAEGVSDDPHVTPEPPALITVPQADLKPLFAGLEECRACQERLAAIQEDLKDERAKVSALTLERDAAIRTARGGGFWARFRVGAKWFVVGGALGAIAASAAHR